MPRNKREPVTDIGGLGGCYVVRFNLTPSILLLLGMALFMPVGGHAQTPKPTSGAVQGTVLVENDAVPVSEVRIFVFGETSVTSTLSDCEGKFSFPQLAPGVYSVEAICLGLRAEQSITIKPGEVVQLAAAQAF
jgi:hypothetical protein